MSINYTLLIWSGNNSGLLISSSSPHRYHERNLHICKDTWNSIYLLYGQMSIVCFYEAPHYYGKEVQFVILLNLWHLDDTMVSSFPKRVVLKSHDCNLALNTLSECPISNTLANQSWQRIRKNFLVLKIMLNLVIIRNIVFFIFGTCLAHVSASKFPSWRWAPPNSHTSPPTFLVHCIRNFESPRTLILNSFPKARRKGTPLVTR